LTLSSTHAAHPSSSRPFRRLALTAAILAVAALAARVHLPAAAPPIQDLRSADADAWQSLRAECVDGRSSGREKGISAIEGCTTYADDALRAAQREGLSLASYVRQHQEELKKKIEEASHHGPSPHPSL
jgi:hypothetical protein